MRINAIYHCPSNFYPLAKSLGFTHVEISRNAWPGQLDLINDAFARAKTAGLNAIVDVGLNQGFDDRAFKALSELSMEREDIVYIKDEPNLELWPGSKQKRMFPSDVLMYQWKIDKIQRWAKTMITLSSIRSFSGYEETADIVGLDYYKKSFTLNSALFAFRIKWFQMRSHAQILGVPPIKFSPVELRRQAKFWKLLGVDSLFWYSWSCNEDKDKLPDGTEKPWLENSLDGLLDFQQALREINA